MCVCVCVCVCACARACACACVCVRVRVHVAFSACMSIFHMQLLATNRPSLLYMYMYLGGLVGRVPAQ